MSKQDDLEITAQLGAFFGLRFTLSFSEATASWDACYDGAGKEEHWEVTSSSSSDAMHWLRDALLSSTAPNGQTYRSMREGQS